MVPSCTNDKSCISTTWIQWFRPVQTTSAVYVLHGLNGALLYKQQELYMYYIDSMVPSCTNNKSCICTTWIQWCRPVQMTRAVYVLHRFNGAVLYKQQELYMYYMDSMVPSCTNNKSCICTTWIQWCRPVQMTRAVYVLHRLNGAVLYKQQELYMYYMDSMAPSCTNDKSSICTT
jgi:succinate dehydrogenase/fumarate reductase cytochrome b subunit